MSLNSKNYPQKVAILYGGKSAEREISLLSGANIERSLKLAGFSTRLYDTAEPGFVSRLTADKPDLVFPALHGRGGEDGTIQGLLEILEFKYVGSGVLASALAMNKVMSKHFFAEAGIPSPPYYVCKKDADLANFADHVLCELGHKLVVKPALEGSSLGMTIVKQAEELLPALEKALEFDSDILVEKFISGIELTVGVLGNKYARALPVIEITTVSEVYDYESKYTEGASAHVIPARIDGETSELCQQLAVLSHASLGCRGISRSDFILDDEGELWLLETNTMPGMTELSLVPDAAAHEGIDMPELVSMLIAFALED